MLKRGIRYSILTKTIAVLFGTLLLCKSNFASQWQQYMLSDGRVNSESNSLFGSMYLKWKTNINASPQTYNLTGSVVIQSGSDYHTVFPSYTGKIVCINNTENGSVVWENNTITEPVMPLAYGSVSGAGAVFALTQGGRLYAMNASTGASIWNKTLGSAVAGASLYYEISGSGYLVVTSNSGTVYKINADNGNIIWSYKSGVPAVSGAVRDSTGYNISYGNEKGFVECLSDSGSLLWRTRLDTAVRASGNYIAGKYFYITNSGRIYALNATTGSVESDTGSGITDGTISPLSIAQKGTALYVIASAETKIICYSYNSGFGTAVWEKQITDGDYTVGAGASDSATLYMVKQSGKIKGYDLVST